MTSLTTLIHDTPFMDQMRGATPRHDSIYKQLDDYSEEGVYTSVKEMREVVMFSNAEWHTMVNLRWIEANIPEGSDPSKATFIQILPQDILDNTVALSS